MAERRVAELTGDAELLGKGDLEPVEAIEADAATEPDDRRGRTPGSQREIADALVGDELGLVEDGIGDSRLGIRQAGPVHPERSHR